MVVFVHTKLNHTQQKLHSKLDHLLHHHHKSPNNTHPGSDQDPLQTFRFGITDALLKLNSMATHGHDSTIMMISFSWLDRGFDLLRSTNKNLMNLIEQDLGHPMSDWAPPGDDHHPLLADAYFSYTLELLDALNSISAALGKLRNSRLSVAQSVNRFRAAASSTLKQLKLIECQPRKWGSFGTGKSDRVMIEGGKSARVRIHFQGKEGRAVEAVGDARVIALWVCGVAISGLGGEVSKCLEFRKAASNWCHVDREEVEVVLEEVKKLNEAVAGVVDAESLADVKREVEEFGEKLERLEKEVTCFFTEVMAGRNRLLDCHRQLTNGQRQ